MNFEELFDANQYTEKAMPICTALCRMLEETELRTASDEAKESIDKYCNFCDNFLKSLTDEQKEEFMSCPSVSLEEVEITAHEHFNRGLKFGVMMMLEIFGKKPIDKDI